MCKLINGTLTAVPYNNVYYVLILLQVARRGMWPEGDGEVVFSCPSVRKMEPVFQLDEGKVKRIRGIAYPHL